MADALQRRCRPLLGTFVEVAAPAGFETVIASAFDAIAHVHARMSFHEETSDLALLRRAKAGDSITVDPETVEVLRIAKDLHGRTGGLFDVAIGVDLVAAGFLPLPPGLELSAIVGTTRDLVILANDRVACLAPMLIDLGGIAKGYAVDRAIDVLAAAGVPRAIVNAGGDLRVLGDIPETIHLREVDGSVLGAIEIADAAVASSGCHAGNRLAGAQILTPHLGRAREPVVAREAVTVIARRCVVADAMTKVALADPALAATVLDDLDGAIIARPHQNMAA
jgi:thiamine biosynthesis lipoprotein